MELDKLIAISILSGRGILITTDNKEYVKSRYEEISTMLGIPFYAYCDERFPERKDNHAVFIENMPPFVKAGETESWLVAHRILETVANTSFCFCIDEAKFYTTNATDDALIGRIIIKCIYKHNQEPKAIGPLTRDISLNPKDIIIDSNLTEQYHNLKMDLEKGHFSGKFSDRFYSEVFHRVLKSTAILDGRNSVNQSDFDVLKYCFLDIFNPATPLPVISE